jgi:hypothetical protein
MDVDHNDDSEEFTAQTSEPKNPENTGASKNKGGKQKVAKAAKNT